MKGRTLRDETASAIREHISAAGLAAGDRVGASLEAMAGEYHAGVGTVRAALQVLSDEGLVKTIPGVGSFVLDAATRQEAGQDGVQQSVEAHEEDIVELYSRLGWERPSQQHDPDGQEARHEQAG